MLDKHVYQISNSLMNIEKQIKLLNKIKYYELRFRNGGFITKEELNNLENELDITDNEGKKND